MEDKDIIQEYINNLRRELAKYLKPGIGVKIRVLPSEKPGGIVELYLGINQQNIDEMLPTSSSVNSALKTVSQKSFGGNLDAFNFQGTNTIMEPEKIIFIKGDQIKIF